MKTDVELFQSRLPARIAGIVFWVLVFLGLLVATYLLHEAESEILELEQNNAYVLGHDLKYVLEEHSKSSTLQDAKARINLLINRSRDVKGFTAVEIESEDVSLRFGEVGDDDDVVNHAVRYYPRGSADAQDLSFRVFYPNRQTVISEMRNNTLVGVGGALFMLGFLLQKLLHRILTVPFLSMVHKAQEFSLGNEKVRFDESQSDEFGYLGRFINHALESLLSQQEALVDALERVSRSEVELNIEKERAEVTLYSITDSVITVDINGRIQFINPAAEKLLAISNEKARGELYNDVVIIVGDTSEVFDSDPLQECFDSADTAMYPDHASLVSSGDALVAVEASVAPMKNDKGELMGAVAVIQDVSHTRRLTRQLSYQASHDMLTGLYNRRKFEERLEEVLLSVKDEEREHALFYLDLDQFKIVNDTCGHIAGDELLQQLPVLFNKVLRSGDVIARLGGDEFGVLLENCSLKQAAIIADKIRQQIKEFRFVWEESTFEIGVSIGVVAINAENTNLAVIMSSADVACYAAKDAGRNRVHIYEASDKAVSERYGEMHWTARITKAMEDGRFRLYQQPIIGISDDKTPHLEVLLRMIDEKGKIIPPGAFLPAAERYNLMAGVDRWVISEVFQLISEHGLGVAACGEQGIVSVNLSGNSLTDDGLLAYILSEGKRFDISFHNICFEITETVAISNLSKATHFIDELTRYGCQFALDDFGSGLSSFAYLKALPVKYLKIDGSFVKDVSRDEIDRAMVQSIQQVGKAMNLLTIAEWVEDEETLVILKEMGIDYVQGNYLGRPEAIYRHTEMVAVT